MIRLQGGAKTLSLVQGFLTGSGIHSASYAISKERLSPREKSGQDVHLTCHIYLLLILRMCGALPTFPLMNVCTRTTRCNGTFIHSLVFSPQAGFSRNQNPVRRPVWLWHTASWANSQGQVAIAFPCLQTFPPSPLGAFTSNDARDLQQLKVELFGGEKCSDKFGLEFDFRVILGGQNQDEFWKVKCVDGTWIIWFRSVFICR